MTTAMLPAELGTKQALKTHSGQITCGLVSFMYGSLLLYRLFRVVSYCTHINIVYTCEGFGKPEQPRPQHKHVRLILHRALQRCFSHTRVSRPGIEVKSVQMLNVERLCMRGFMLILLTKMKSCGLCSQNVQ